MSEEAIGGTTPKDKVFLGRGHAWFFIEGRLVYTADHTFFPIIAGARISTRRVWVTE